MTLTTNKPNPSLEGLFTFSVHLPSDLNGSHTLQPDVKIWAPTDPDIENFESLLQVSLERTNMTNICVYGQKRNLLLSTKLTSQSNLS